MNNPKKIIGQNIRELRQERNWTQEQLAERCSIHRTYIGSVERGERNICLENILRIARAFDVSPKDLFEGIE